MNSALRNTDNHARNTAFIKYADGTVKLSPLYDFAPMFLDPEGIARASVWGFGIEDRIGMPEWIAVGKAISELFYGNDKSGMMAFLHSFAEPVSNLPSVMIKAGVEEAVVKDVETRCNQIAVDLRSCRQGGLI